MKFNTYYNMNETHEHYSKWKDLVTEDHILYDFVYMNCPNEANPYNID